MTLGLDLAAILVAVLQVGDMVTTLMAMSRGAREANPLVAAAIRLIGRVPGLAAVKAVGLLLTLWLWQLEASLMLWALAVVYAWVVVHNINVYRRRGRLRAQLQRAQG